ncbi:killer toxin resistant protein [Sorochytrium milnesiophthora]
MARAVAWQLPLALAIAIVLAACSASQAQRVEAKLKATWSQSSLAFEALELVHSLNELEYFGALVNLTTPEEGGNVNPLAKKTERDVYERVMSSISTIQSPERLALLKMSLAMHEFAPKIQAYTQIHEDHLTALQLHLPKFDPLAARNCALLAVHGGEAFCSLSDLARHISSTSAAASAQGTADKLPFEHVFNGDASAHVIVYGDVLHAEFGSRLHSALELATKHDVSVWFRYNTRAPQQQKHGKDVGSPLWLSGYGVELAIKSSEYKVIDDRDVAKDRTRQGEAEGEGDSPAGDEDLQLENASVTMRKLTESETSLLGVKAAQFIVQAADPLKALQQVSQNFPKYAMAFAGSSVNSTLAASPSDDLLTATANNARRMGIYLQHNNALWLNGLQLPASKLQPFALMNLLRKELNTQASFKRIIPTASANDVVSLMTSEGLVTTDDSEDIFLGMFDASDLVVVKWLNDLEADSRYSSWTTNVRELLRPTYPGQLRYIARNLFSAIFVLDMSKMHDILLFNDLVNIIRNSVPIRFGVVPKIDAKDPSSPTSTAGRLFHILLKSDGLGGVSDFFVTLSEVMAKHSGTPFKQLLEQAYMAWNNKKILSFSSTLEKTLDGAKLDKEIAATEAYLKRLSLTQGDKAHLFLNGKYFEVDERWQQLLLQTIQVHTEYLMQKVYLGEITSKTDVFGHFMKMPTTLKTRNEHLFVSEDRPLRMLDFGAAGLPQLILPGSFDASTDESALVTVVADLDAPDGIRLALSAMNAVAKTPHALGLVHSGTGDASELRTLLAKLATLPSDTEGRLTCAMEAAQAALGVESDDNLCPQVLKDELAGTASVHHAAIDLPLSWKKTIAAGKSYVLVNGRIVGPVTGDSLDADVIAQLVQIEWKSRNKNFYNAVKAHSFIAPTLEQDRQRTLWMLSSAYYSSVVGLEDKANVFYEKLARNNRYASFQCNEGCFEVGDAASASIRLDVVLNPVSEGAQKWSVILSTLRQSHNVYMRVILAPEAGLKQLPLNRFYRYLFDAEPQFSNSGRQVERKAVFHALPREPIYTMGLDIPAAWLTTPVHCVHDLDNIKLSNMATSDAVLAEYELSTILVEGHARDVSSGAPPSGLQFVLQQQQYLQTRSTSLRKVDTIVMANLGYFQFKAYPGAWELKIREGPSQEIYQLDSIGDASNDGSFGNRLYVASFEGVTIFPKARCVSKRPGKEKDNVLSSLAPKPADDMWSRVKAKFTQYTGVSIPSSSDRTVNIFSVASGHLYERFLSIMFVSVLRHTKNPVKFWLIENFLSPSFREFVPRMAKKYGFQYEFVTYKWPSWLRAQKEKQRTIWGYKILFLDVLFPLNLDKVIFVDADQIVRTDLKDLLDVDLQGAPYGYTPFCDSRREMEGFRFWKKGYWKDYLQGRPYHISALYVVDLNRFRQLAAGDRLRGQYQALSADPNSLANLDQDLPNNMQEMVPIHSLPIEWLWCETWCSDGSLARAKTIDLCNNPMTKEPKLERAKRLIPEWEEYDEEVQRLRQSFDDKQHAATTASSVPGDAGFATQPPHEEL